LPMNFAHSKSKSDDRHAKFAHNRSKIPRAANSTHHTQVRAAGEIPIAPATPLPLPTREFLPWRFSDAGHLVVWMVPRLRRPKTCTGTDIAPSLSDRQEPPKNKPCGADHHKNCNHHAACATNLKLGGQRLRVHAKWVEQARNEKRSH
jgi:hypothetical protein